jgi:plasmid stability protein
MGSDRSLAEIAGPVRQHFATHGRSVDEAAREVVEKAGWT